MKTRDDLKTTLNELDSTKSERTSLTSVVDIGKYMNFGVGIISHDLKYTYLNPAAGKLTDLPAHILKVGASVTDIATFLFNRGEFQDDSLTDMIATIKRDYSEMIRKGVGASSEWQNVTTGGRILKYTRYYVGDPGFVVLVEDITQTTRNKRLLDLSMKLGNAAHWEYDFGSQNFAVPDAFKRWLTEDEATRTKSKGIWHLIYPVDIPLVKAAWEHSIATGEMMDVKCRLNMKKTGIRWVRAVAQMSKNDDGKITHAICYAKDIHMDKQRELELKIARDQALEAAVAKTRFLAMMSHEVRTPMNGIIAMGQALVDDEKLSDDQRQKASIVSDSATSLLHLLNDMLDHAKLSAEKVEICPAPSSLKDILESVVNTWKQTCRDKGVDLTLKIHPSVPPSLIIDGFRYRQVANNLLSNAVKFTSRGHITVSAIYKPAKDGMGRLVLGVKDSGIGMDQHGLETLFAPYEQADISTSRQFGGTGLGMAICKELTDLMGGKINVQSTPGEGSLITVGINCETATATPSDANSGQRNNSGPSELTDGSLRHLTILVAEDIEVNRMIVDLMLKPYGPRIIHAENGKDAVEILAKEQCDLVLMDIHMPEMDGIEATLNIRGSGEPWAQIPIIALTADADAKMHRTCINIGMDASLTKPLTGRDLTAEISTLIQRGALTRLAA